MSLRFRYRMVHKTVADYVEAELADLGWVNDPVNFGTTPLTLVEFQPDEAGKVVAVNTVAITLGDEPPAEDEELGDGIRSISFPVFVDIYGANQAIALSIASDVKTLFEDVAMPVTDFSTVVPGPSEEYLQFDKDDVEVERPTAALGATDFKRYWRVVKALAVVHYVQS